MLPGVPTRPQLPQHVPTGLITPGLHAYTPVAMYSFGHTHKAAARPQAAARQRYVKATACLSSRPVPVLSSRPPLAQRHVHIVCGSSPAPEAAVTTAPASAADKAGSPGPDRWRWEDDKDALVAYGVLASVLLLGSVPNPLLRSDNGSDLLYFMSLAVCTQYIGAHRSLTTEQRQQLSIKEGLLAPVLASTSLLACYLIIRFLPDINISTLLNAYFWLLGSFAGIGALSPILKQIGGPLAQKTLAMDVPEGWVADENNKPITRAEFAPTDVLAVLGALALSTGSLVTGHYTLNNTMACLIATDILQLIGIRSFRVAGALLVGLLLYDVFWVFGSPMVMDNGDNVMLTVATSDIITGPSRLLFPRTPGGVGEAADFPYSLLGLGDIAIPGLLACLALRYDASRSVDMGGRADAAITAMQEAWAQLPPGATGKQMADSGAQAAAQALDRFAEQEDGVRNRLVAEGNGNGVDKAAEPGLGGSSQQQRVVVTASVLDQRTYFTPVLCAYVGGLAMAFAANSITHLGQPALLYIVPSILGAVLVTGATRSEVGRLWSFTDVPTFGLPTTSSSKDGEQQADGK